MKVVVLGSGESCLNLSDDELLEINSSDVRIALNKFALFNYKVGIDYTHVYFNDLYGLNIYIEIIKSLKINTEITIITNLYLSCLTYTSYIGFYRSFILDLFYRIKSTLVYLVRFGDPGRSHELILARSFCYYRLKENVKLHIIKTAPWDDLNAFWAKRLEEPLYSFRGSIMSVLNYISIKYPGSQIICVGTDFNGSSYFYEDELEKSGIDYKDYTTEQVKAKGMHYSFHNISQGKLSDAFPKVINNLSESNNTITCNNECSLLVTECNVVFKPLCNE